jgi:hypothetical protein
MLSVAVHPASAGISWRQLALASISWVLGLLISDFSCNKQGSLKDSFIYCALTVRVSINLQFMFVNLSLHVMPGLAQISRMPPVSASHFRLIIWLASMSLPRIALLPPRLCMRLGFAVSASSSRQSVRRPACLSTACLFIFWTFLPEVSLKCLFDLPLCMSF